MIATPGQAPGAAGIQLDQHRSAWLALVTHEHRALRNGQVHAGTLDVVQAGDGARQFAFKAATVAGRFHELAGAQALLLVEDFETDVAVAGSHASGREFQRARDRSSALTSKAPELGSTV
jgi:hypothetical protein